MNRLSYLKEESLVNKRYFVINKSAIRENDIKYIQDSLTFKPKAHKDFEKFVKPIKTYKMNDKYLMVPRFWGLENIGTNNEKYGKTTEVEFNAAFPPREYQHTAINTIMEKLDKDKGSTLSVGCGFGKTACSLIISAKLKLKTLIVVHTTVLLNQWIERIEQFIENPKIGVIKGNKFDIEGKTHVIAMVQTLVSKTKNFTKDNFKDFGFTIFDEVHHMSAPGFSSAYGIIATKYVLGLTATPDREDGLQDIFLNNIGRIGFRDSSGGRVNGIVEANIINYSSDSYRDIKKWNGSPDLHKMLELIINNRKRNIFITNIIKEAVKEEGRQLLVLSTRISHLTEMKEILDKTLDKKYTSAMYIGGMKTEELEESSKANILFASYQLVSEGTDIPTLNTLIQTSPKKNVEQVVGRIMRGKTPLNPIIYDIVDDFSVYKNQFRNRKRFYKKNDYAMYNFHYDDDNITSVEEIFSKPDITKFLKKDKKIKQKSKQEEIECMGFDNDDFF